MYYLSAVYNVFQNTSDVFRDSVSTNFVSNVSTLASKYQSCLAGRVSSLTSLIFNTPIEGTSWDDLTYRDHTILQYMVEQIGLFIEGYGSKYQYCLGIDVFKKENLTNTVCNLLSSSSNVTTRVQEHLSLNKSVWCYNYLQDQDGGFCKDLSCRSIDFKNLTECIPSCMFNNNTIFSIDLTSGIFNSNGTYEEGSDSLTEGLINYGTDTLTRHMLDLYGKVWPQFWYNQFIEYSKNHMFSLNIPTPPAPSFPTNTPMDSPNYPFLIGTLTCGVVGVAFGAFLVYRYVKKSNGSPFNIQTTPLLNQERLL